MKGIIFTQFLTMVEEKFNEEMVDQIIADSHLSNDGAYTAIGTYDYHELITLITELSKQTGISVAELEVQYGKYLFNYFINHYNDLIKNTYSTFDMLKNIDNYIHVEVRKLYPEAELPRFFCKSVNEHKMILDYSSIRPFADFAEGLMQGCAEHFGEKIVINREIISPKEKNTVRFYIEKIKE